MITLFNTVLRLSIAGGLMVLVIYFMQKLLKNTVPKAWVFSLWLVAVLLFAVPLPFSLPFNTPHFVTLPALSASAPAAINDNVPAGSVSGDAVAAPHNTASGPSAPRPVPSVQHKAAHIDAPTLIVTLWLTGAATMLLWSAFGYGMTIQKLKHDRILIDAGRVPVYESARLSTPLLAGLLRPAIYLPKDFESGPLAIRHELCHLRRGDLCTKWLVQLVVSLHWFNPLVYIMKRELHRLSELACDESVVRHMDETERRAYGHMLLQTLRTSSSFGGPMTAALGKNKKWLKERMHGVMLQKLRTKKAVAAIIVLALVITAAAIFISGALHERTGFVNDREALGTWQYVTDVQSMEDFDPVNNSYPEEDGTLIFGEDGIIRPAGYTWSKGVMTLDDRNKTTFDYDIQDINGQKYLFVHKSVSPGSYMVLRYVSNETAVEIDTDGDLSFVDDPAAIGTWQHVGTVENFDDFDPSNEIASSYQLVFAENGVIGMPASSWSKGIIRSQSADMTVTYEIEEIDGSKYMFCTLSIDETLVKHDVLKWVSSSTEFYLTVDDVDLPFVDDPAVLGTWNTVDFVSSINSFNPAENPQYGDDLPLTKITFQEGGGVVQDWANGTRINVSGITWTSGFVLDRYKLTASAYEIKEINGSTYLFYQWKSGDYTYHNMTPQYYVLEQAD